MEILTGIWDYVVPFVVVLTVLVYVHEMGHYLIARLNGVRVEAFSIGFGPELFGWTNRHETRWKICAVPLGGYVKMFGDKDGSSAPDAESIAEMTAHEKTVSFYHKRLSQRTAIVAAGPIANFLFAIVVFTGFYMTYGQPSTVPEVAAVVPESAADRGGLSVGDLIVDINGRTIDRFEDVQLLVQSGLGSSVDITVVRDGKEMSLVVLPEVIDIVDRFGNKGQIGRLGIRSSKVAMEPRDNPFDALWHATLSTYDYTMVTLRAIGQFISGARSTKEMAGPIGIAKLSGDMASNGISGMLLFMAILSINLGLINLFPVPVLDGGHLLFYLFEAVRGRPLGQKAQEYGFRFGLGLVLLLMIFVTWNDLVNIVSRLV
ncbi:MAG: RIP metalloprotease RseP [Alphaproteobacteria bacterium]|nr:RIP metalloprotease RseP [Alphaproteobacteria bacterium]